ncbi:unnamed protein product [Acanthoscelides obtectus]|uniref:Uncharacterized protein n=1 Tax=Acanthoscelides obtectus TaxID=200917 RepID=A0A9P0NXN8_ACAOB|nr:unnamed protein product [Acanthoscelides obtectus]CAK1640682.1 hypothetical protein AOBTE_LOCUS11873 [Acanthoscelides obtectus]
MCNKLISNWRYMNIQECLAIQPTCPSQVRAFPGRWRSPIACWGHLYDSRVLNDSHLRDYLSGFDRD